MTRRFGIVRFLLAAALCLGLVAPAAAAQLPADLQAAFDAAKKTVVTDSAESLRQLAKAEAAARRLADPQQRAIGLATAYWLAGEAHLRDQREEAAARLLAKGLALVSGMPQAAKLRADLLMSQGVLFRQRQQAVEALDSFQRAYRIFAQLGERRSQSVALQNIAALYQSANDGVRAEAYYRQAGEVYKGDPLLSLSLHNNRGAMFFVLGRHEDAAHQFEAAIGLARKLDEPALEARAQVNLARAQITLGRVGAAERALSRGFALSRQTDSPMLQRHLLGTSALLESRRGNYAKALRLIRQAFDDVDVATTSPEFRNLHFYARDIFTHMGDTRAALQHVEALRRLDDEAAKVATTTGAALMAARFNYAEQQARIQQLKAEEAERTARYQRTLFKSIGGATLAIIAMLIWGLIAIRRSRNEVRAANVVLGDTNVALEKALKAKTEFLATTSHEIRTPLNGILGMTQVMLSDASMAPEMRERVGIVHGAGMTMRSLVDDILDLAKMETGNLSVDPQPMDLCAALREVTRLWEEQARAKGLLFRLERSHAPQWIVSDAGRLRQILFNLLSNAVKFTAAGAITVRASDEGEGADRRLRLCVHDTGIGIPADKLEEIFESFRQADAGTTRRYGGTGLGLTICRRLAQALGGDVTVESTLGSGSRFILDLPLVLAQAPEATNTGACAGDGVMLVLDRNPIARSMLRSLFEARVGALRFAGDLDEALAICAEGGVAQLVVDEAALRASPEPLSETLRKLVAAAPHSASVVLWARPDPALVSEVRSAGIGKVIEKPVGGAALVEALLGAPGEICDTAARQPLVSRAA